MSSWARFIYKDGLVAELYRSGAEGVFGESFGKGPRSEILSALELAGRQLVETGKVEAATMATITQPLANTEQIHMMANLFWKTCIEEGITPKEFDEKGMMPRPDSLEAYMIIMPMGFSAKNAGDTKATLQFLFSGAVEGACNFRIENGEIRANEGVAQDPDLTIETPFEVWTDIMTGKADGQQAFMAGKYQVKRRPVPVDANERPVRKISVFLFMGSVPPGAVPLIHPLNYHSLETASVFNSFKICNASMGVVESISTSCKFCRWRRHRPRNRPIC